MHHLRKKKSHSDASCSQYRIEEGEASSSEPKKTAGPANKMDESELSIVISDSDSLEPEEEGVSQKKQAFHRKSMSAKLKIARMTEEEQLALAVKISQQEQANHVKHRQEEDELLRKAIEESLHSCKSPIKSTIVTVHDLRKEASSDIVDTTVEEQHTEHLSQQSQISSPDSSQNPKVLLKRLSQDIVESSSVILSPNSTDPLSCIESCKASTLSQNNSNDFTNVLPFKASVSPVFPVKSIYAREMVPCRLFEDKSSSAIKSDKTEDNSLHCSERTQLDASSLISNSDKSELIEVASSSHSLEACLKESSMGNASVNNADTIPKHSCQGAAYKFSKKQPNDSNIHYYWGIPFCPNGEDPNAYTQVILCQLEVYEKSLKKSQRQLSQKSEYGQPIDLSASAESSEPAKDSQGNLSQEDTEETIESGDQQKTQQSMMETIEETDSSDIQPVPSKRTKASCSQSQGDDHSGPSEEQIKSQTDELCTKMLPSKCEGGPPEVFESPLPSADMTDENSPNSELPIQNTQEESVCPETQLCSEIQHNDQENQPDLTETGLVSSQVCCLNSPPAMMVHEEAAFPSDVECPMCGCQFAQNQIERHAAYCDGAKDEPQMAVLRPRNRQSRHPYNGSRDSAVSSESGKLEKCYLCKSLVTIKDYQTHVDKCLQSAALETQGAQKMKSSKETTEREGRLLSMLEQSESTATDENNSAIDFPCMSPPREEHTGNFSSSHLSINDSPIRSFVSISEATDCLVDFKKQLSRPPKREPNKRGFKQRGKKRRM